MGASISREEIVGIVIASIVGTLVVFGGIFYLFVRWMRGPMKGTNCMARLDGKVVAITGANTGIGYETALEVSRRGARVILLCRDSKKAETAAKAIHMETGGDVDELTLDLASLKSVRECASKLLINEDKVDILINNAGVMLCPEWKTDEGFDMQFAVNHLGHFLLTELIAPLMRKSEASSFHPRIIILSSAAHVGGNMDFNDMHFKNKPYSAMAAYCNSKLANVLHAKELARRLSDTEISVYCVHPGVVATELGRHAKENFSLAKCLFPCFSPFIKKPVHGAQTSLYCALENSLENQSGRYYADCKEKSPSEKALREEDQKKLWEMSEELTGLKV